MLEELNIENPNDISEENIIKVEKQVVDSGIDLNYLRELRKLAASDIPVLEAIALKMVLKTHNYFILEELSLSKTPEIAEKAKLAAAKAKKHINPRHFDKKYDA